MVEVPIPKEKWSGKIGEVTLGATIKEGGTRSIALRTGGESGMPFLSYEGTMPNRPLIAGEVLDSTSDLPDPVKAEFGDATGDPVNWARAWVERFGADLICIKLVSTSPDEANRPPQEAVETVKRLLEAVEVPIIVYGCGNEERDAKTFELVSNLASKERLLIGHAEDTAYKSIAAATMANHHAIISFSNLDINLAKQINILLTDFGVKKDEIIMDPLMAALGMGLEYSYSVMERIRLAAFMGDGMLQVPLICDTSVSWKAKEAAEDIPGAGGVAERAVWWEATTALAALLSGADILIMRSPASAAITKRAMADLTGGA
ncbi:MAG: acetyl-CoA decarbonylase/synthase complex subunit delta [Methanomassiliicoccales archaeon]|nr:acetyl-CoA decarbonylase/synthase complex subunit delta [Methanomassiliicoccales archaeon]